MTLIKSDLVHLGPMSKVHIFQPMIPQLSFIMKKGDAEELVETNRAITSCGSLAVVTVDVYNIMGISSQAHITVGIGGVLIVSDMDVEAELKAATDQGIGQDEKKPSIALASTMPSMAPRVTKKLN